MRTAWEVRRRIACRRPLPARQPNSGPPLAKPAQTSLGIDVGGRWARHARCVRVAWHDLVEGLARLDHAELAPRPFFDGRQSDLQVLHFGLQLGIALAQAVVLGALVLDGILQPPDFARTAVGQPESVLKPEEHGEKDGGEDSHRAGIVLLKLSSDNSLPVTHQAFSRSQARGIGKASRPA